MTAAEIVVAILVGVAIAVGIVGTLVPVLPGLILIWLAMGFFGIVVGFGWIGWSAMAIATCLVAFGMYLNVRIPQRRAASTGLALGHQALAGILAVIGLFVIPIVGAPLGFALGVFLARLHVTRDRKTAWASTRAILSAVLRASAAQAACGVGMGLVWLVWVAVGALA